MPNVDVTLEENLLALKQLCSQLQQQLTEQQAINIVLSNRLMKLQAKLDGLEALPVPDGPNGLGDKVPDAPQK